ncbi:50S ribosome-binding GTPase [Escherichia coli]
MSFSHSSLSAQVKSYLTFLPEEIRQKILEHLHGVIHYEPVIGIMGKSGTGKSSLCNAIFQSRICATHPLNGCTRQAHRLTLQIGERRMTLVDLATLFPSSFPVLSVAAPVGWNLPALVSLMIHALPPQATSAVYSHIRGENRSEQARKHAQQTFGDAIGKSFDDAVARFSFPAWMLQLLRKARARIIHLLVTLWDHLF